MARISLHKHWGWLKAHRTRVLLIGGGVLIVGVIVFQAIAFRDRLPLFLQVEGQSMGGWNATDAAHHLEDNYANAKMELYVKSANAPFVTVVTKDIGASANYDERAKELVTPLWLRLIPSSVLWSHWLVKDGLPTYAHDEQKMSSFVTKQFGEECKVAPKNATLVVKDGNLSVIPSENGGECDRSEVEKTLKGARADIQKTVRVDVPVTPIAPSVQNAQAEELQKTIEQRIGDSIVLVAGGKEVGIEKRTVIDWLEFDASGEAIAVKISQEKSDGFFKEHVAPLVAVAPGVTKVTTQDFQETARTEGAQGRALNFEGTRVAISQYLTGDAERAEASVTAIPAKVEYTRHYSDTDTGLSAILKHNAEDHKGILSVSMIELSGKKRRASYNGDARVTPASTYKLFVAYSILKRTENGQLSWSDQVTGGRNLEQCFDDMVVQSDNACPEAIISRIGRAQIQADVQELGMKGTDFRNVNGLQSTANDLAQFTAMLEARQLPISRASQDKLIAAMRRNVYRQGIPAGSSGAVADKVGFLDGLLHDAAIVYSPSGTYALAIMTDGSSWAEIAALTRKIEELRG